MIGFVKVMTVVFLSMLVAACSAETQTVANDWKGTALSITSQPIVEAKLVEAKKLYREGKVSVDTVKRLEDSMRVQPMIRASSFRDIFVQADHLGKLGIIDVSDVATQYIKQRYEAEGDAIRLLIANGFTIHDNRTRDRNRQFMEEEKRQLHIADQDDGYIYASKLSGVFRPRIFEVYLYTSEGRVHRVMGIIKGAYPPL